MQRKRYRTDVGFITYRIEESVVTLETVLINRGVRGQGYGTKMLQSFLNTLNDFKVVADVWGNRPLNFYRKLGLKVYEAVEEHIYEIEKEIKCKKLNHSLG